MTTAEHAILAEIALTGQAVIILRKARETKAAEILRSHRIIHIHAGNDRMWIVKFGPGPLFHQPLEI